jgi:cytoskeleton protein RodZ
MSEGLPETAAASAGALLRAARERQGLHIAALAAAIKVSPRKLEALEAERYDELVDLTFTRALAQAVCRALKIDAAPVLALLPQQGVAAAGLEQVTGGLNAPFRDKPGRREPSDWTILHKPAFWATLLVLLAAAGLYLMPGDWLQRSSEEQAGSEPAASGPLAGEPVSVPAADPRTAPLPADPAASAVVPAPAEPQASAAAGTAGVLLLSASAQSWVEVFDGAGQPLLSRNLQPGETLGLDGGLPLRVTIGNAAATRLSFRGQALDLVPLTRDNVARLELK